MSKLSSQNLTEAVQSYYQKPESPESVRSLLMKLHTAEKREAHSYFPSFLFGSIAYDPLRGTLHYFPIERPAVPSGSFIFLEQVAWEGVLREYPDYKTELEPHHSVLFTDPVLLRTHDQSHFRAYPVDIARFSQAHPLSLDRTKIGETRRHNGNLVAKLGQDNTLTIQTDGIQIRRADFLFRAVPHLVTETLLEEGSYRMITVLYKDGDVRSTLLEYLASVLDASSRIKLRRTKFSSKRLHQLADYEDKKHAYESPLASALHDLETTDTTHDDLRSIKTDLEYALEETNELMIQAREDGPFDSQESLSVPRSTLLKDDYLLWRKEYATLVAVLTWTTALQTRKGAKFNTSLKNALNKLLKEAVSHERYEDAAYYHAKLEELKKRARVPSSSVLSSL